MKKQTKEFTELQLLKASSEEIEEIKKTNQLPRNIDVCRPDYGIPPNVDFTHAMLSSGNGKKKKLFSNLANPDTWLEISKYFEPKDDNFSYDCVRNLLISSFFKQSTDRIRLLKVLNDKKFIHMSGWNFESLVDDLSEAEILFVFKENQDTQQKKYIKNIGDIVISKIKNGEESRFRKYLNLLSVIYNLSDLDYNLMRELVKSKFKIRDLSSWYPFNPNIGGAFLSHMMMDQMMHQMSRNDDNDDYREFENFKEQRKMKFFSIIDEIRDKRTKEEKIKTLEDK